MTAVTTTQKRTAVDLLRENEKAKATITALLPEGVKYERVIANVQLAFAKNPDLDKCNPGTVVLAVAKILGWGLEPGETAHLVPFGATCTAVPDYRGLVELAIASGVCRHADANVVYANEDFRPTLGTNPGIDHIRIADPKQRGAMIGAYAIFWLRFNHVVVDYMSVEEIDAIRQAHSKQWKKGAVPEWYAKKTVVRRGVKLLPKNARLAKTLAAIDETELSIDDVPEIAVQASRTLPPVTAGPPKPLAAMTGYEETAKVITAPPIREYHVEEAQRVLAEQGGPSVYDDAPLEYQDDSDLVDQ